VNATFKGDKFIANPARYNTVTEIKDLDCCGNSGIGSIALAIRGGASKIILLGYDCQATNGKIHWHDDYPKHMGNAVGMNGWPKVYAFFSERVEVPIYNATRETALDCFPRIELEDALAE
jgi:hypothetical protein